jgi:hypothetical protein
MKGRRVLENFGRWSKHSVGLGVSSWRSAPSIHHLPRRKSMRSSLSRFIPIAAEAFTGTMGGNAMGRRPSSVQVLPYSPTTPSVALPLSAHTVASRKLNLEFTPTSPMFSSWSASRTMLGLGKERDEEEEDVFVKEKEVVAMSGSHGGERSTCISQPHV